MIILCICGHAHLIAPTCGLCGCTIYEPDDGTDGPNRYQDWGHEPYEGQYHPPKGYQP